MLNPAKETQQPSDNKNIDETNNSTNSRNTHLLRSSQQTPSPSQMGHFLHAVQRKHENKSSANSSTQKKSCVTASDEENSRENKDLFSLVKKGKTDERKSIKYSSSSRDKSNDINTSCKDTRKKAITPSSTNLQHLHMQDGQPIETSPLISTTESYENDEVGIVSSLSMKTSILQDEMNFSRLSDREYESKYLFSSSEDPSSFSFEENETSDEISFTNMALQIDRRFSQISSEETIHNTNISSQKQYDLITTIDALVQQIVTLKTKDLTTTEIVLKNPPLFEGATLSIQESSSARNEFNITFSGLSPDARKLIESFTYQQLLQSKLLEEGYTLRMVTIDPGLQFHESQSSNFDQNSEGSSQGSTSRNNDSGKATKKRQDSFI